MGEAFQVNGTTLGRQFSPKVVPSAGDGFLVVWSDQFTNRIAGRGFDAAATAVGSDFDLLVGVGRVDTASDGGDRLVLAWSDDDGSGSGIFAQLFDHEGVAQTSVFRVNSHTSGLQDGPAVAMTAAGDFLVVWSSADQDGHERGIFGQRFDPSGSASGGEFQVNTGTVGSQDSPDVAMDSSGRAVVVWGSSSVTLSIVGRRFDGMGMPDGDDFAIDDALSQGFSFLPKLAVAPDGPFLVAWEGLDSIHGRRFDALGNAQGGGFVVHEGIGVPHYVGGVTEGPGGSFVVVWEEYGFLERGKGESGISQAPRGGCMHCIRGRAFGGAGMPAAMFTVDEPTALGYPAVGAKSGGEEFVVAWTRLNDIQGRRYALEGSTGPFFADGFESGGVAAWTLFVSDG